MSRITKSQFLCLFVAFLMALAGFKASWRTVPQYGSLARQTQWQATQAGVQRIDSVAKLAAVDDSTQPRIEAGYGSVPLSFEPNRGQTDPQVKFLSRAGNRTLWLTGNEAVLAFVQRSPGSPTASKDHHGISRRHQLSSAVLRMKFLEANTNPRIDGEDLQPGTVNYFPGERTQWRTRIPTYARVRYHQLYPGVDLVFYGNNNQLEYDLVVSPGADPRQIKLAVEGADSIRLDAEGNLVLKTPLGELLQQKPKIYQRDGARLAKVEGDFVMTGVNEIGFRLGRYDRGSALVIDPALRYSTFLGGNNIDQAKGIGVDSSNRAVVGGITCSLNFPRTVGPKTFEGCSVFITKFDFTGSHLVFSTFIGESAFDVFDVGAMALDSQGNSYATGEVEFFGFPTTPGSFEPDPPGPFTGFVVKLSADGAHLIYSTFLGGHDGLVDEGRGITADSDGNAYITGSATSSDFPTTSGVFQPNCKKVDVSCGNAFITKLSSDGSHLIFSTFLGGTSTSGEGIALDKSRNVFVTGSTDTSDFPTTAGSAQPVFPGGSVSFVTKLSSSGSHLIYSTFLRRDDRGRAIAVDASGNAFVATGDIFITGNAGFVTKLSPNIGRLLYSRALGGAGTGIAVTSGGQAVVTGVTSSPTFPTTQTAFQRVIGGTVNAFLTKLDFTGHVIYSSFLGGSNTGLAEGMIRNGPVVALDPDANAYVAGTTLAGYPVTPGAFQSKFGGGDSDAFVAKVVSLCALNSGNRTVTICTPGNGSNVGSPVNIVAGTTDATPVKLTQIYLDGKKIFEIRQSAINLNLPIATGTHRLTVQALDTANVFFKSRVNITVH
jgi:beta-propeller repeat-containing protein/Big-like domain-containing protein